MIRFLLARRVSVYGGEQWTSILTPILEKDDVITLRLLCQYDGNLASASIDTGFTSQSAVVNSIRLGAAKCTRFLLTFVTNAQNIMTDDVQHCALMTAINELDADTVIQISRLPGFSEGLNTNRFDNGATYLHLAVAVNPTATNHRKKDTIVKVLLRAGADVNFPRSIMEHTNLLGIRCRHCVCSRSPRSGFAHKERKRPNTKRKLQTQRD